MRHVNVAEIGDFATKVGVKRSPEIWQDRRQLYSYRGAFCAALRDHCAREAAPRTWTLPFVIRHSA